MPLISLTGGLKVNMVRTAPTEGTPIIFLHAMGMDLTYWDHQIAYFGTKAPCFAFDLPGHDLPQTSERSTFSFEAAGRMLEAVITYIGGGAAHLVGLSLGGQLAMAFALSHPESVKSLSLINTASRVHAAGRLKMETRAQQARTEGMASIIPGALASWFTPEFQQQRPDLMDRIARSLLLQDPQVNASMWEQAGVFDLHTRLPQIKCPTLVIVGDKDVSTPPSTAQEIADAIPHAQMELITNSAHLAPIDSPGEVNRLLEAFLIR